MKRNVEQENLFLFKLKGIATFGKLVRRECKSSERYDIK